MMTFQPKVLTSAELAAESFISKVAVDDDGLLLDNGYFIAWERISTPLELLHWVAHLSGKTWVDCAMIEDIIEACNKRFALGIWEINP